MKKYLVLVFFGLMLSACAGLPIRKPVPTPTVTPTVTPVPMRTSCTDKDLWSGQTITLALGEIGAHEYTWGGLQWISSWKCEPSGMIGKSSFPVPPTAKVSKAMICQDSKFYVLGTALISYSCNDVDNPYQITITTEKGKFDIIYRITSEKRGRLLVSQMAQSEGFRCYTTDADQDGPTSAFSSIHWLKTVDYANGFCAGQGIILRMNASLEE